ncbi:phage tail spike protein [Anaerovoracaceae bacterium SGI.195]
MRYIVLDRYEKRLKNATGFNSIRKAIPGKLDTLEFETYDNHIQKDYRILYLDTRKKWREFIVSEITEIHDEYGISYKVFCENSISELRDYFILDKRLQDRTAQQALDVVLEGTNWIGRSEVPGTGSKVLYRQSAYESINDLLEIYSCEIETNIKVVGHEVTERQIVLKPEIGQDKGKRFAYSKDLLSIERVVKDDIITALFAYGKGEEKTDKDGDSTGSFGRRIDFAEVNNGKPYIENNEARKLYGFSGRHKYRKVEFDDITDKNVLLAEAKKVLEECSKPRVTYTATVADLKSYGYQMEGVLEGDKVVIRDKELSLALKARVTQIEEYLDNQEDTKITLGNFIEPYGKAQRDIEKKISRLTAKEAVYDHISSMVVNGEVKTKIEKVLEAINKEFITATTNMFFDVNRGIVLTDKKKESDSKFIVEIGSHGIRFANNKLSNGGWDWKSAITSEGIAGENITTHSVTANKLASDVGQSLDLSSNTSISLVVKNEIKDLTDDTFHSIDRELTTVEAKIEDVSTKIENAVNDFNSKNYVDKDKLLEEIKKLNDERDRLLEEMKTALKTELETKVTANMDKLQEQVDSSIDQTAGQLRSEVSDRYYLKEQMDAIIKEQSTQLTQTAKDFEFRFRDFVQDIDSVREGANARFSEMQKYIRFVDGEVQIGNRQSNVTSAYTSDGMQIKVAGQTVANFSKDFATIKNLEVQNQLKMGSKWAIRPGKGGNLNDVWIG